MINARVTRWTIKGYTRDDAEQAVVTIHSTSLWLASAVDRVVRHSAVHTLSA
jgi:hypothetical protein